ncbi:MAG: rhodanese-like domain-containing protein [Gammaproteobacteria bacterium]|nr:MAG: rhodanese-like domain-containing protein [Gammaproteobacteria bacterium]
MYKRILIKTLFPVIFTLLSACSVSDGALLDSVSATEAATMVQTEAAIIIDVREQNEWDDQHIPGAIHIPLGEVKSRLSEIGQYKDKPIVMQCRSGKRSAVAANILKDAGFEHVSNMNGGINAWKQAKLPVE